MHDGELERTCSGRTGWRGRGARDDGTSSKVTEDLDGEPASWEVSGDMRGVRWDVVGAPRFWVRSVSGVVDESDSPPRLGEFSVGGFR